MKTQCPTCSGSGEITIHQESCEDDRWGKYAGDKDLFEKYSHAAVKTGKTFSPFYKIASFYRSDGDYSINFWEGGSWPIVIQSDIEKKFLFLERKTGKQVTFECPKLKPFKETAREMLNADPSFDQEHFVMKVQRLGFKKTDQEIRELYDEWEKKRTN